MPSRWRHRLVSPNYRLQAAVAYSSKCRQAWWLSCQRVCLQALSRCSWVCTTRRDHLHDCTILQKLIPHMCVCTALAGRTTTSTSMLLRTCWRRVCSAPTPSHASPLSSTTACCPRTKSRAHPPTPASNTTGSPTQAQTSKPTGWTRGWAGEAATERQASLRTADSWVVDATHWVEGVRAHSCA